MKNKGSAVSELLIPKQARDAALLRLAFSYLSSVELRDFKKRAAAIQAPYPARFSRP